MLWQNFKFFLEDGKNFTDALPVEDMLIKYFKNLKM